MINNIVINATNIVINLHLQYKTSKYFSINFRMQTRDYCRGNAKHLTLHSALFFVAKCKELLLSEKTMDCDRSAILKKL